MLLATATCLCALAFPRGGAAPQLGARRAAAPRGARVLAAVDVDDDVPRVRFVRDADVPPQFDDPLAEADGGAAERAAARADASAEGGAPLSVNERLQQRIDESVAKLPPRPKKSEFTPVDLNGVEPLVVFGGGVLYSAFAAGAWYATGWLAVWFAAHPVPSDVYIAARAATVVRTLVVGLTSMFAGVSGVTSLGMYGLAARVTAGVLSGELDPKAVPEKSEDPRSSEVAEGLDAALDALLPRQWRR